MFNQGPWDFLFLHGRYSYFQLMALYGAAGTFVFTSQLGFDFGSDVNEVGDLMLDRWVHPKSGRKSQVYWIWSGIKGTS